MARCRTCWSDRPAVSGCPSCNPQALENQLREVRQRLYDAEAGNRALRDDSIGDARRSSNMRDAIQELEAQLKEARDGREAAGMLALEANANAQTEFEKRRQAEGHVERLAERCQDDGATIGRLQDEVAALRLGFLDARQSVRRFATAMEAQLRKNDSKGADGWLYETYDAMLSRLADESEELKGEIMKLAKIPEDGDATGTLERVVKEAADVANFAMFIADLAYKGDRA